MKHTEYIIPIGEDAEDYDEMFIGVIRRQPELVRCYDCRYFKPYTDSRWAGGVSGGHCSKLRQSRDESLVVHASKDFCSRGWRKKEE